ncbi:MAG: hypothetical protein V4635_04090 [Bacteroidota bacterium]
MNLSFKVNKHPEFIFDYLTDMQKYVSVHPVITKIDSRGNGDYLVHETLKLAFLPLSFTYPVNVSGNSDDKTILIKATVMKITKIEMMFKIIGGDGFSTVDETIHFQSPLPVKNTMQNIFRKQHTRLFKNIAEL